MSMEAREESMASDSTSTSTSADESPRPLTIKRTRTRRHRPTSSASAATASSSASEAGFTDEEDMANCLILLAQGGGGGGTVSAVKKFTSKRFAEAAATAAGRAGFYAYECKTCNRCFPSFQALGGHRASHKKLRMAAEAAATAGEKKGLGDENNHLPAIPGSKRTDSVGKGKMHECSICQSEFSSGQALGGHMRRHRPAADLPEELKKEKTVLALDLNLPAPADDDNSFAIPGKPLVFQPAAPLVDCLY